MTEGAFGMFGDPALSMALVAAATAVAATSVGILAFTLHVARRRLDALDAAQAETAAMLASELRKLATATTQRRAGPSDGPARRTAQPNSRTSTVAKPATRDAGALHLPLRKTLH